MEFVFVVERDDIFPGFYPHGFLSLEDNREIFTDMDLSMLGGGFFVERSMAERRIDWKQIIPYTVLRKGDDVWVMTRGRSGGEPRLYDMLYIGIGGHINPFDAVAGEEYYSPWKIAACREFSEEAVVTLAGEKMHFGTSDFSRIGLINDDTNPVGAVHLGLVYEVVVPDRVKVQTEDEGHWVHVDDLDDLETGELETWTHLVAKFLCSERQ